MDACIRSEFGLSEHEYRCLLRTLDARFGVKYIEDLAFVSPAELAAVACRWENAALRRLFEIVTTHIGVEKLYRAEYAQHKHSKHVAEIHTCSTRAMQDINELRDKMQDIKRALRDADTDAPLTPLPRTCSITASTDNIDSM